MSDDGLKKGCLIFLAVAAILAAGAGLSVVLRGKHLKPRSRSFMLATSQRTLDEIVAQISDGADDELKRKFRQAYDKVVSEMENKGAARGEGLERIVRQLDRIREDGEITPREARGWINMVLGSDERGGTPRVPGEK